MDLFHFCAGIFTDGEIALKQAPWLGAALMLAIAWMAAFSVQRNVLCGLAISGSDSGGRGYTDA